MDQIRSVEHCVTISPNFHALASRRFCFTSNRRGETPFTITLTKTRLWGPFIEKKVILTELRTVGSNSSVPLCLRYDPCSDLTRNDSADGVNSHPLRMRVKHSRVRGLVTSSSFPPNPTQLALTSSPPTRQSSPYPFNFPIQNPSPCSWTPAEMT